MFTTAYPPGVASTLVVVFSTRASTAVVPLISPVTISPKYLLPVGTSYCLVNVLLTMLIQQD